MKEQLKLFDIPEEKPKPKSKYRCRKCEHIYKHEYGKMKYCKMQKGYNTAYGDRKIKANDFGCEMFKLKTDARK